MSILISQYQKMGVVLVFWERHSAWISLAVFHNGFHGFHDAGILLVPNHGDAEFRTKRRELAEAISAVHFGRLTNVISNAVFAPQHVPQFYKNSGICWFAAMCWTSFANDTIASIIRSKIRPEMRDLCKECLSDRNKAQQLRNMLWSKYSIGDDISQPPEMDGRNGFSEFTTLCAKFGIPMIRYKENSGIMKAMEPVVKDRKGNPCTVTLPKNKDDPHLLVLRYQDGDHTKFPVHRRIQFHKQRYKLCGMYMGSRKCGHQIGASTIDDNWRHWGIGDADLHKSGIGPFYIIFSGSEWNTDNWWKAWKHVVHVTKFGTNTSEFCNINPQNPNDSLLDKYRGTVGSTSVDVLYAADIR
jgi:hypothetical protein